MGDILFPKTGQGPAKLASAEDLARDELGYTHPNLHRRIDPQQPEESSQEYKPRDYSIGISNVNSYRTTTINTHNEDSETSEIP